MNKYQEKLFEKELKKQLESSYIRGVRDGAVSNAKVLYENIEQKKWTLDDVKNYLEKIGGKEMEGEEKA